jgi:hypothetical protein
MNRLRAIAIEEQHQLVTFAFAIVVFMLTLLALQLRGRGPIFDGVGNANRDGTSRTVHENRRVILWNRGVALAVVPSIVQNLTIPTDPSTVSRIVRTHSQSRVKLLALTR